MKAYFWILITLFPFGFLKAQNNPDSLTKKLSVSEFSIYEGNRLAGFYRYDIHGNLTYFRLDDFWTSTYLKVSTLNIYNKNQQLTESKSTHSSFPKDTTIWNYNYDANGHLTSIKNNDGRTLISYSYNTQGKKESESILNVAGQMTTGSITHYDEKGNETEVIVRFSSIPDKINKIHYDTLNRKIREELFSAQRIVFTTNYLYDGRTPRLIKETYDEDGDGSQIDGVMFKYDSHQRLIARLHFSLENGKEKITGSENFDYLDNGLIKTYSENIFTAKHTMRSFVYSYNFYTQQAY